MESTGITFKFDVKKKGSDEINYKIGDYTHKSLLRNQMFYDSENDKIAFNSHTQIDYLWPHASNALIDTIFTSYNNHIPLKLDPNNVWLAILIAFGKYVNKNSRSLKSKLVNDSEIKKIIVKYDSLNNINDWSNLVSEIIDQIKLYTKEDIIEWSTPNFSTTTNKDRLIANISLMSGLRKFFSYEGHQCCGLTEVTLMGTLNDWQEIVKKAHKLYEFGDDVLTNWAKLLIPVLEEFCNAYQGNVKEDFWQRICSNKKMGSGDDQKFRGWFMVFAPFSSNGEYILRSYDQVQSDNMYADIDHNEIGTAHCDVDIILKDLNDHEHSYVLFGGILYTQYDNENNVLSPSNDFMIIKKKFVSFEDMQNKFYDTIKLYRKSNEKTELRETIIKFVHFICSESNIPNNMFSKITQNIAMVVSNCYDFKDSMSKEEICKKCLGIFLEYDHLFSDCCDYINFDMQDSLINKFKLT